MKKIHKTSIFIVIKFNSTDVTTLFSLLGKSSVLSLGSKVTVGGGLLTKVLKIRPDRSV